MHEGGGRTCSRSVARSQRWIERSMGGVYSGCKNASAQASSWAASNVRNQNMAALGRKEGLLDEERDRWSWSISMPMYTVGYPP